MPPRKETNSYAKCSVTVSTMTASKDPTSAAEALDATTSTTSPKSSTYDAVMDFVKASLAMAKDNIFAEGFREGLSKRVDQVPADEVDAMWEEVEGLMEDARGSDAGTPDIRDNDDRETEQDNQVETSNIRERGDIGSEGENQVEGQGSTTKNIDTSVEEKPSPTANEEGPPTDNITSSSNEVSSHGQRLAATSTHITAQDFVDAARLWTADTLDFTQSQSSSPIDHIEATASNLKEDDTHSELIDWGPMKRRDKVTAEEWHAWCPEWAEFKPEVKEKEEPKKKRVCFEDPTSHQSRILKSEAPAAAKTSDHTVDGDLLANTLCSVDLSKSANLTTPTPSTEGQTQDQTTLDGKILANAPPKANLSNSGNPITDHITDLEAPAAAKSTDITMKEGILADAFSDVKLSNFANPTTDHDTDLKVPAAAAAETTDPTVDGDLLANALSNVDLSSVDNATIPTPSTEPQTQSRPPPENHRPSRSNPFYRSDMTLALAAQNIVAYFREAVSWLVHYHISTPASVLVDLSLKPASTLNRVFNNIRHTAEFLRFRRGGWDLRYWPDGFFEDVLPLVMVTCGKLEKLEEFKGCGVMMGNAWRYAVEVGEGLVAIREERVLLGKEKWEKRFQAGAQQAAGKADGDDDDGVLVKEGIKPAEGKEAEVMAEGEGEKVAEEKIETTEGKKIQKEVEEVQKDDPEEAEDDMLAKDQDVNPVTDEGGFSHEQGHEKVSQGGQVKLFPLAKGHQRLRDFVGSDSDPGISRVASFYNWRLR